MKQQIVRFSIVQVGKISAAMYAIMGLFYTLIGIPMLIFGEGGMRYAGIAYILMPIIGAVFGFIFVCIFAAIYNVLAKYIGGVEFELEEVVE